MEGDNLVGEAQQLWATCTEAVRPEIGDSAWATQLRPARAVEMSDGCLVVAVPSSLVKERIERTLLERLNATLAHLAPEVTLTLVVRPDAAPDGRTDDERDGRSPAGARATPTAATIRSSPRPAEGSRLINPRSTFEAFVIGSSNQFAYNAALAVAETPLGADNTYNPLFIYGPTGLGKTHLLHAIANYVRENYPQYQVCYAATDTYVNDFVNAIRFKTTNDFKTRYRDNHVLLLDDIQFLEGKTETEREFFHAFNEMHQRRWKIIMSSDRQPTAISLQERLTSRLQWGLTTDIQPPELETRLAILRKKAEPLPLHVPEEVLELVAAKVTSNIRKLEGALNRLVAYSSLKRVPLTPTMTTEILGDFLDDTDVPVITCSRIIDATAKTFGISAEDLTSPGRTRPLVNARQVAMYLCREMTNESFPSIGRHFGGRDHTTVMHAVDKIKERMKQREQIYWQVTRLVRQLGARS